MRQLISTTREAWDLTAAGGADAANRQMRAAGRTVWNEEDAQLAAERTMASRTALGFFDGNGEPTDLYFAHVANPLTPFAAELEFHA
jgi:IS4 transposase